MKKYPIGAILTWFALITALAAPPALARQYALKGKTMGTFYTVKFISSSPQSTENWQKKIDIRLREVNQRMSIFQKNSEISTFNRAKAGEPVKISRDFYHVMTRSQELYHLTDGAWDGTVKPLVDLWGFGTLNWEKNLPAPKAVEQALTRVGFPKIIIGKGALEKEIEEITRRCLKPSYAVLCFPDLEMRHAVMLFQQLLHLLWKE